MIRNIHIALIVAALGAGLTVQAGAQTSPPPSMGQGNNNQDTAPGGQGGSGGGGQHHSPPPVAIAACQGKIGGASCSFTGRQNEALTGTCFGPPTGGLGKSGGISSVAQASAPNASTQNSPQLACRPDRGGPGGGHVSGG